MPLEAVQLLYTAWWILQPVGEWINAAPYTSNGKQRGYRATHVQHPLARWVRRSTKNYRICVEYALALCREYTQRYHREHSVQIHAEWMSAHVPPNLPQRGMTPIPICTAEGGKARHRRDAVRAYRRAYIESKSSFARYRHCKPPAWMK
jgi:hypothetical protein